MTKTVSLTQLAKSSDDNTVLWFDENMPYVYRGGMFWYYWMNKNREYILAMTSIRDVCSE